MESETDRIQRQRHGLRKRWLYKFAGQAMQGIVLNSDAYSKQCAEFVAKDTLDGKRSELIDIMVRASVNYAEALLAELEKREADNAKKG